MQKKCKKNAKVCGQIALLLGMKDYWCERGGPTKMQKMQQKQWQIALLLGITYTCEEKEEDQLLNCKNFQPGNMCRLVFKRRKVKKRSNQIAPWQHV